MASVPARQYPDIEALLHEHGVMSWEYQDISLDQIDVSASRTNQGRFRALHEDTVARYENALENGAQFPPIIVYKPRGKTRYTIIAGNHRDQAHRNQERKTISAVVLKAPRPLAVSALIAATNANHGLPITAEEAQAYALHLVDALGVNAEEAAKTVGMKSSTLRSLLNKRKASERGRLAGIENTWKRLPAAIRTKLNTLPNDEALVPAAELAAQAAMDTGQVAELVSAIKECTTVGKALKVIKAARNDYADQIQETAGGKIEPSSFDRGRSPKAILTRGIGNLDLLPDDLTVIVRSFTPDDALEMIERMRATSDHLDKVAVALEEAYG